ncbi:MAG TPA: hypothetical protein EYP10_14340 [Armatimonadetes bacterium]|nr:hypothetical protein [Armatimonadota bacterium]
MNFRDAGLRGIPISELQDIEVADVHAHMGHWYSFPIPYNDIDGIMHVMNRVGVRWACISACCSLGSDFRTGNDLVAEAMHRYPNRIIAYATLNPNYHDGVAIELDRCERMGFRAIKLHSIHGCRYNDERYQPAFEIANAKEYPVLLHTWGDARDVERLAKRYPHVRFILAHAGVVNFDAYVQVAKACDNVWLDTALSISGRDWIRIFVERVSAEKIVFGSDIPFISLEYHIGKVLMSRISDEDKEKILSRNFKFIFAKLLP